MGYIVACTLQPTIVMKDTDIRSKNIIGILITVSFLQYHKINNECSLWEAPWCSGQSCAYHKPGDLSLIPSLPNPSPVISLLFYLMFRTLLSD